LDRDGLTWFQSNQKVCIILDTLVFKNKFFWWWVVVVVVVVVVVM